MLGVLLCFAVLPVATCGLGVRKIVALQFANFVIPISLALMVTAVVSLKHHKPSLRGLMLCGLRHMKLASLLYSLVVSPYCNWTKL